MSGLSQQQTEQIDQLIEKLCREQESGAAPEQYFAIFC